MSLFFIIYFISVIMSDTSLTLSSTNDEAAQAKWRELVHDAQNTLYVVERPTSNSGTLNNGNMAWVKTQPDPHVCFIRFVAQFQAKGLFSFESLCNNIGQDVADELMRQIFRIILAGRTFATINSPLEVRDALGRLRRKKYYADPFSALDFTILIANYTMTLFYEMSRRVPPKFTNREERAILELSRPLFDEAKKQHVKFAPAYAFYKICQHLGLNNHLPFVILNPVSGVDITQDKEMKSVFEALAWTWIDTNGEPPKKKLWGSWAASVTVT